MAERKLVVKEKNWLGYGDKVSINGFFFKKLHYQDTHARNTIGIFSINQVTTSKKCSTET